MTRDDIVQMAHLAGLVMPTGGATENQWKALEIFAELATEKERNRILTQDHWTEYERKIAAAEREACAKDVEAAYTLGLFYGDVAAAIRARGSMNDLYKIAFDYRNAVLPDDAHEAWIELENYVKQLINDERASCAIAVSDVLYGKDGCGKAIEAIRARGQA